MHKITTITFFIFLIAICFPAFSQDGNCDGSGWKAIEGVEKGEVQPLKTFLESGGDPLYFCPKPFPPGRHNGSIYIEIRLSDVVMRSESFEIVNYYLSYPIPQHIRNQMLMFYALRDSQKK